MHCNPKWMKPIVSPTKCCDVHDLETINVPHIHPSHTTYHHHKKFNHLHTYPHTTSNVTDVSHQHFNCGPGMAGPMPGAPMPGGPMGGPMPGAPVPGGPMGGPMPGAPMPGGPMGGPMPGAPMPGGPMGGPMPGPYGRP